MRPNFLQLIDSRVHSIMRTSYAALTNTIAVANILDNKGSSPATTTNTREPQSNNELFVWGSRWGGSRIVGG